eukprot:6682102-Pyramimonas_sp.AAC.1
MPIRGARSQHTCGEGLAEGSQGDKQPGQSDQGQRSGGELTKPKAPSPRTWMTLLMPSISWVSPFQLWPTM